MTHYRLWRRLRDALRDHPWEPTKTVTDAPHEGFERECNRVYIWREEPHYEPYPLPPVESHSTRSHQP